MKMLERIFNILFLIPIIFIMMLVYTIYPVIGYILGRGFYNSIERVVDIIEEVNYDYSTKNILVKTYYLFKRG